MKTASLILPLVFAFPLLTGCVTRGYKLADKNVPPPTPLNLTTLQPPLEATLGAVIVYQGPGSWKREAYWDEYVVTIANRGAAPLVVTAASLSDGKSDPLAPGADPWALEKLSKKWWETNAARQTGTYLALGAGAAGGAALAAANFALFGPTTAAFTAGAAVVVAAPLIAGGTVFMNLHRKHQVEAEFTRRRLALPLTLAPGQTAQGSLFFRITPGPQRLVLRGHASDSPREVTLDLAPLAGLHLKPATAAPAAGNP